MVVGTAFALSLYNLFQGLRSYCIPSRNHVALGGVRVRVTKLPLFLAKIFPFNFSFYSPSRVDLGRRKSLEMPVTTMIVAKNDTIASVMLDSGMLYSIHLRRVAFRPFRKSSNALDLVCKEEFIYFPSGKVRSGRCCDFVFSRPRAKGAGFAC